MTTSEAPLSSSHYHKLIIYYSYCLVINCRQLIPIPLLYSKYVQLFHCPFWRWHGSNNHIWSYYYSNSKTFVCFDRENILLSINCCDMKNSILQLMKRLASRLCMQDKRARSIDRMTRFHLGVGHLPLDYNTFDIYILAMKRSRWSWCNLLNDQIVATCTYAYVVNFWIYVKY